MRINRLLVLMVLAAAVTLALATVVPVASATTNGPLVPPRLRGLGAQTSTNWAGYDATRATNRGSTFTSVSASWVVRPVTSTTNAYASFWVGLDGDGSNSVEQIGTSSDYYVNGGAYYYAWYEMYPKMPVTLSLTVKPGDTISASVVVVAGAKGWFSLTLTDVSTGESYNTMQQSMKAKLYSAEVIAEAPWSGGVLPLANFGSVLFTQALFNGQPIGSFSYNPITMVTSGGTAKATPSTLTDATSGSAFTIFWKGY